MPGNSKLIAQLADVRSNEAEVFGDEWKFAELPLCGLEELGTRPGYPLTRLRRRRPGGHMPRSRKSAEVIEPNHVHMRQQRAQIDRCTSGSR